MEIYSTTDQTHIYIYRYTTNSSQLDESDACTVPTGGSPSYIHSARVTLLRHYILYVYNILTSSLTRGINDNCPGFHVCPSRPCSCHVYARHCGTNIHTETTVDRYRRIRRASAAAEHLTASSNVQFYTHTIKCHLARFGFGL